MRVLVGGASPAQDLSEALESLLNPQLIDNIIQPSLLEQLEEAAEPSGGLGSGKANVYKSPASLDVIGLLRELDTQLCLALRLAGYGGRVTMPRVALVRLVKLHANTLQSKNPLAVRNLTPQVHRWAVRAHIILTRDPQIIETRAQPCPRCGKRTVLVHSEELGERVQRPSLYLDTEAMLVYCRCCGSTWGPSLWPFLRRLLELAPR